MITKLPYGLRNEKLVSIYEVEKGLACNCICPACKNILIAKKGNIKVYHFSHYETENCEHGIETALHLAAKKIIEEKKSFTIPELIIEDERLENNFFSIESLEITIEDVQSEVWLGDIKPDILATINGKSLIIEIAVTHFVDKEKYEKIRNKGISAIEVDLSKLKDGFSRENLINEVIVGIENKYWIFNAREKEFLKERLKEEEKKKSKRKRIKIIKRKKIKRKKRGCKKK